MQKYKVIQFPFVSLEPTIEGYIHGKIGEYTYFNGVVKQNEFIVDGKKYTITIEECTKTSSTKAYNVARARTGADQINKPNPRTRTAAPTTKQDRAA